MSKVLTCGLEAIREYVADSADKGELPLPPARSLVISHLRESQA